MAYDYLPLIPVLITALLSGIVVAYINIRYYKNKSYIENKKKFLQRQITELLLPLYIQFIDDELLINHYIERSDQENLLDLFNKNLIIEKIINRKLHLASPELFISLVEFKRNVWLYSFKDENGKIDREIAPLTDEDHGVRTNEYIIDNYLKLRDIVDKEFDEKMDLYRSYMGKK